MSQRPSRAPKNAKRALPPASEARNAQADRLAEAINAGMEHHQAGRLDKAESIYRQIIRQQPRHPDAIQFLGLLNAQRGKLDEAIALFKEAISLRPSAPVLHYNLGIALQTAGQPSAAIASYLKALKLKPDYVEAHVNIGNAFKDSGKLEQSADHYTQALALNPDFAYAHINLGLVLHEQGKLDQAEASYNRALRLNPDSAEALNNLAGLLLEIGKTEEAVTHITKALKLKPDYAEGLNNLGSALLEQGKAGEAVEAFRKALELKPNYAKARNNLGHALSDLDRIDDAIDCYKEALRLEPRLAEAHNNLGHALQQRGEIREAIECFHQAIKLKPNYAEPHANLSSAFIVLGKFAEADSSAAKAIEIEPRSARAYFNLTSARRLKAGDPIISSMEDLLGDKQMSDKDRMYLCFALGKVYDETENHGRAFKLWLEANRLKRQSMDFNIGERSKFFSKIKSAFNKRFVSENPGNGYRSQLPIFIVGMPRSGTTLVEQILASHPQVHGAGELGILWEIADDLRNRQPYPECMMGLPARSMKEAGKRYVDGIRALNSDASRICDKLPQNFVHLGLIALILPQARIIHCKRNPLDTCVSAFSILFSGDNQPFTYNLEELGQYYRLYEDMMSHWKKVLPQSIFEVRYEELICGQEAITRDLISFCGLEWDDRCLRFHKTERPVLTASNTQVRQPIYAKSVERWRRYGRHLTPLKRALAGEINIT